MHLPSTIRQWSTDQNGFDNLALSEATMPTPGPNEVLVKINTIALNYRDTEVIQGLYNHHKTTGSHASIIPCSDICGHIVSLGSSVTAWNIGDRVLSIFNQSHLQGQIQESDMATGLGLPLPGTLCTYRVFPQTGLVAAPTSMSDEEACTLPISGVTAWMALNWARPIGSPISTGEVVLLQGTGGVSIAGLVLAKAAGATVIITSSSNEKLSEARKLGADFVINYRETPEWQLEVLGLTQGVGADIIFENGGAKTLARSFDCVRFGGMIACIGYLSGKEVEPAGSVHTNVLALRRNVTLKGLLNGPANRFQELVEFVEANKVRMVVDRVYTFDEAREALKYLASGFHFGKVVIKIT